MLAIECINEKWPTSNSKPGVYYALTIKDHGTRHYYTVEDLQSAIDQASRNGLKIIKGIRVENHRVSEFKVKTRQELTDEENRDHCRRIAEDLEAYAEGRVYRCPECGETVSFPDGMGDKYRCPHCENVADIDEYEPLGLWDYLSDVYDVEYYIGGDKEVRGVRVMVACGGPNIYIDSKRRKVELYWWTDYAEWPLYSEVCDELDQWAEEYWGCC